MKLMKIDSIENPILNQDFALARKQIKKYLHRSRFSDESKLYAAIYYRWMGEFSRALKLLAKYIHPKALEKATSRDWWKFAERFQDESRLNTFMRLSSQARVA